MKKIIFILSILSSLIYADICKSDDMREVTKLAKELLNPPVKVDLVTTLTDVVCKDDALGYIYELNFNSADEKMFQNEKMQEIMKKKLSEINKYLYCESNFAANHRKHNIAITYTYYKDKEIFLYAKITKKDCEDEI